MRHVLPLLVVTATLSAAAVLPKLGPLPGHREFPAIRFLGASRDRLGWVWLDLEMANPRTSPVWFPGFRANSYNPPLPEDRISPLWFAESPRTGIWELLEARSTFCLNGFEQAIALPAKAKATFEIHLPEKGWEEARVCVPLYFIRVELATKLEFPTSPVITRQQVEKALQAEKTPPEPRKDGK